MFSNAQPFATPIQWSRVRKFSRDRANPARNDLGRGRATILAVDDEHDALDFLRTFLSAEGFDVVEAASGAEALALIEERRPDLLIVDVMMPGMTGLELCGILREHAETRDIPIILYSAHDMKAHSNSGLYDHAFVKPADPEQMLWTIRSLLPAEGE